jgi:putative CocE/NonD family hydrolase
MTRGGVPVSEATYEVKVVRDVRIPTADPAVTLGADLHLPAGAGPVPVLALALPYRKDFGGADLLHRYFARRGYACLTLDLMGTGSSDGVPRAPFATEDAQDAVDAITWAAEQEWCDGSAGMWGHSYGGMMTMRTASRRPAPLKAIIPVQGFLDPEVDFVNPDHARGCFGPATWMSGMVGNLLVPPVHAPDDDIAQARWRKRLEQADTHVLDLYRHRPGAEAWRERVVNAAAIDVPALCFVGWRDLFADAQARAFEAMTGPKRMVAGPWMHILPVVADEGPLDFLGMCLAWWDRWLKGLDNGADAEPTIAYVQGPSPYWTALDTWPVQERTTTSFEAGDGLRLELTNEASVPDPTVGLLSGLTRLPTPNIGLPSDQHDDDLKSTCWTSAPLDVPLTIAGRPEVVLDQAVADRLVVKVAHVDPAGRSVLITSGALGEGAPPAAAVVLDATAFEVPAGHRIRVVVSEADFPRLWPRLGAQVPQARPVSLTLPTLRPSEVRRVEPPEQPAHLTALVAALQAGPSPSWTLQRDILTGTLTMSLSGAATAGPVEGGPAIDSSSSTILTASPTAPPTVRTSNDWVVQWPGQPPIAVNVEATVTDEVWSVRGRVTTGEDVTFDKTWSTEIGEELRA